MPHIVPLVFVCPPAGKPDPQLLPPVGVEADLRPRVMQRGSKGRQAWYYAFNALRMRHGKHPAVQLTPARQFERAASALRKALTVVDRQAPGLCDQLGTAQGRETLTQLDLARSRELLAMGPALAPHLDQDDTTALRAFVDEGQKPHFFAYLMARKYNDRAMVQQRFLEALGVDYAASYPRSPQARAFGQQLTLAELAPQQKAAYVGAVVAWTCAELYGLRAVAWTPQDPVAILAARLGEYGPLAIAGHLGRWAHQTEPLRLSARVANLPVWGWPAKASRPLDHFTGNMVLLVGCEHEVGKAARVYFIDPAETAGGPDAPQPRIYGLSYGALVERCCDRFGILSDTPSTDGYLLAGPRGLATAAGGTFVGVPAASARFPALPMA